MKTDKLVNVVVSRVENGKKISSVIGFNYATPAEANQYVKETKELYEDKLVEIVPMDKHIYLSQKNYSRA